MWRGGYRVSRAREIEVPVDPGEFTGLLAGRARDQAQSVRDNARTTQSIYELSRKLSGAAALIPPGGAAFRLPTDFRWSGAA